MKVLFSNPPWWTEVSGTGAQALYRAGTRAGSRWPWTGWGGSKPDRFRFGDYLPYPYFMGYAATWLARETGVEVVFRDSIALKESYNRYFDHVRHGGYAYIFVEGSSPSWPVDTEILQAIHEAAPESKLVVTGPITASRATEILEQLPVHACIKGEYEKGSVRVIEGESGVIDYDLLSTEEMNHAPFPYYDPTYAKRYWDCYPVGQQRPHAQVWSSRGCPFKCIFCVWPATMTGNDPDGAGRRLVRQYSKEWLEAFLGELVERYHYKTLYFDDDTFNLGDRHVLNVCEVMSGLGIPWAAMCRADTIARATWRAMRESGCFGVKIGFESGNQYVVDHIVKKRLDLEAARETCFYIKELGMSIHGTFTLGLPGETKAQMEETVRYRKSLPLDSFQESGTAVIEGTPLNTLLKEGALAQYDGAHIDGDFSIASDGSLKAQEIIEERGKPGL